MIRRLLVMLGLLTVFWVVARQMKKRLFGGTDTEWEQEAAGGASIPEMVRSEPLQPSAEPAAGETAEPSEAEAVTPPHGDPLQEDVAEVPAHHEGAEVAPAETVAEQGPGHGAGGGMDGGAPSI